MEVCVDNIQSVLHAYNGGAMRLELCSALSEGGLTPSMGFLMEARRIAQIPIFVMIRPRNGNDFVFSKDEMKIMKYDLNNFKENGADGFVFGALTNTRKVDLNVCKEIVDLAAPLPCTFHRAFDFTDDPYQALEDIISVGFTRILTSGHAATAEKGIDLLRDLIVAAENRIIIVPGCGINEFNVARILNETNAIEFHGSAKRNVNVITLSDDGNSQFSSNSTIDQTQFNYLSTDQEAVKRMVTIAEEIFKKRI